MKAFGKHFTFKTVFRNDGYATPEEIKESERFWGNMNDPDSNMFVVSDSDVGFLSFTNAIELAIAHFKNVEDDDNADILQEFLNGIDYRQSGYRKKSGRKTRKKKFVTRE